MTTITPSTDPAAPPGAEPDLWVGGQRDVYRQIGYVAVSPDLLQCPAVTVVAEQFADGRIGCVDVVLDVAMSQSHAGLGPAQARELAGLLVAGADTADQWAGLAPRSNVERLADAFAILRAVHMDLRAEGNNAADYVLAALDGISDAGEALR